MSEYQFAEEERRSEPEGPANILRSLVEVENNHAPHLATYEKHLGHASLTAEAT